MKKSSRKSVVIIAAFILIGLVVLKYFSNPNLYSSDPKKNYAQR